MVELMHNCAANYAATATNGNRALLDLAHYNANGNTLYLCLIWCYGLYFFKFVILELQCWALAQEEETDLIER